MELCLFKELPIAKDLRLEPHVRKRWSVYIPRGDPLFEREWKLYFWLWDAGTVVPAKEIGSIPIRGWLNGTDIGFPPIPNDGAKVARPFTAAPEGTWRAGTTMTVSLENEGPIPVEAAWLVVTPVHFATEIGRPEDMDITWFLEDAVFYKNITLKPMDIWRFDVKVPTEPEFGGLYHFYTWLWNAYTTTKATRVGRADIYQVYKGFPTGFFPITNDGSICKCVEHLPPKSWGKDEIALMELQNTSDQTVFIENVVNCYVHYAAVAPRWGALVVPAGLFLLWLFTRRKKPKTPY